MVSVTEQIEKFHDFIESNYKKKLHQIISLGHKSLVVDFGELAKFDPELSENLLNDPREIIPAIEAAISQFDLPTGLRVRARVCSLPKSQTVPIKNIRSSDLRKLVAIEGIIRQTSDVRPKAVSAKFECPACGNVIKIAQDDIEKFKEPSRCSCGRRGMFKLLSKELIDIQRIVLEEAPESLQGGEQPKRISVFLEEDLVEPNMERRTTPGAKIRVVGEIKEHAITLKSGAPSVRHDLNVDANYVEPIEETYEDIEISEDDERKIKELASDPNIFKKLINSIAPSIFGHEDIKEGLILQMMGGLKKVKSDGTIIRGDMHVLLVGDPGAAKSTLLLFISKAAPKARYVVGKSASGAGITASVVRDEFLKTWALEGGALVLSNGGFCLTGDSKILLADSKVESIKSVCERVKNGKKVRVKGMDENNFELKDFLVKKTSVRRADKLYKLTFDTGEELKITGEHPLLKWNNGVSWVSVDNLDVGDYIVSRRTFSDTEKILNVKETLFKTYGGVSEQITEELMEFVGLIATDGSLSKKKNTIRFYNKSKELGNRYCYLTTKLFNKRPSVYVDKRSDVKQFFFSSKGICDFLCDLGVVRGNKSKMNFDRILSMPNYLIKSFLIGALNGDGSVSNRKGGGIVDLACSSEETAKSYRNLFRKIGIIARDKRIAKIVSGKNMLREGSYVNYRVSITGISNIVRLNDSRLVSWKFDSMQKIISRKDTSIRFPLIKDILSKIRELTPHYEKHLLYKNSLRVSLLSRLKVTRDTLMKVVMNLSDMNPVSNSAEYKLLKSVVLNEVIMPKIVKKEELAGDFVYNIEVDGNHNFFANFLLVHNCCIDELDKMDPEDRSAMHEALAQQTVTVSKANINATLKAETTVLAAANPKLGRFDPYQPIASQIDLPPTLINRFDLIFPVRDLPSRELDTKIATRVLDFQRDTKAIEPDIPVGIFKKYVAYVRQKVFPKLSEGAIEEIKEFYVNLRNQETQGDIGIKPIPITARQLEALVRLAEGSARVRLSETVTRQDAKRAINILKYCLMQVGMDYETGQMDIDRIGTGITAATRSKMVLIREVITAFEAKGKKTIPIEDIISEAIAKGLTEAQAEEILEKLKRAGDLFEPKRGHVQRI